MSAVQPSAFNCEGGLILNRSTFMMQPGEALELRNFEPDIEGGYRRINGFSKYVSAVVPHTSSTSEKVLMVATFGSNVLEEQVYLVQLPVVLLGQVGIAAGPAQVSITLNALTLTAQIR